MSKEINSISSIYTLAETDWVLVDAKSGRPMKIPDEVKKRLPLVANNEQPQHFDQDAEADG